MLAKLLVYFLCISLLAFIYVYKIPIFCTECQKPTGTAASIFRCIIDEDKLCNVHNEMIDVQKRTSSFFVWVKNIVTKDIPDTIFEELNKIFSFFENIGNSIKDILEKIKNAFMDIKKQVVDKVVNVFTDLTTNLTNMFTEMSNGIKNFAFLIYQSIDNLRNNIVIKIKQIGEFIQTKIQTEILDKINDNVITPVKVAFEKIGTFFSGLVNAIITPFKDLFENISGACVPELKITDEKVLFTEVDLIVFKIPGLTIPKIAIPKFCPFDSLNALYDTIKAAITTAFDKILSPVTSAIATIQSSFDKLGDLIKTGAEAVKTSVLDEIKKLNTYITTAFEPIKTFFGNLGNDISINVNAAYTFIKEKLTEISNKIISFFINAFDSMWREIKKIFQPVIDFFGNVWDSFMQVYKNFIKGLNDVYIEVKKQWTIVYDFIKERIFYVAYIVWINFIDWMLLFLPISKIMKVNIVNGILVMGLIGVGVYYYNMVGYTVATSINGVLTILGDLYGVLASVFPLIAMVTDAVYTLLSNLPTLTFAMDTFAFLSPARIIPIVFQQLIDLAEVFVGGARDIILTPYLIAVFICVLTISIGVGIHKYMDAKKIKATAVKSLPELPQKIKMDKINIDKIQKKWRTLRKDNIVEPVKDEDMSGVLSVFTEKMANFKKRVDLIEEVRKEFEYNPNYPDKILEMNLTTMTRRLDEKIAEKKL
jgi:hypothetical protein